MHTLILKSKTCKKLFPSILFSKKHKNRRIYEKNAEKPQNLGDTHFFTPDSRSKIKTCSDDPIPAELLKNNIDLVLPSLVKLVNLSLTTGEMDGLKDTVVTPLLKNAGADPEKLSSSTGQ